MHLVTRLTLLSSLALPTYAADSTPLVSQFTAPATLAVSAHNEGKPAVHQARIQIAILLDNSGSMEGLIEQAKSQIWSLVNTFIHAKQHGQAPIVEVSVWTYGTPPPKMLVNLSSDLDRVSEELFSIGVNGGTEHCGQTIDQAVLRLKWSQHADDLKMIFIAGNEPFNQGPIDYRSACPAAQAQGIIVNTIHCGTGIPDDWLAGALLGRGKAMNIDQNKTEAVIDTPYDNEISILSVSLNATYIAYGTEGKRKVKKQRAQDLNAASVSASNVVQRAVCKSNHLYKNDSWDLVDASEQDTAILDTIEESELPAVLQGKTRSEVKTYVQEKQRQRSNIQTQINTLNAQRQAFILENKKEQSTDGERSLDDAMKSMVIEQARRKSFIFE